MPSRPTISLAQFLKLRSGAVVVWRGKYLRTIQKGPADERTPHKRIGGQVVEGCVGVEFAIRRRSWRNRPTTHYNFTDLRDKIRVTGIRSRQLVLETERLTLDASGFVPEDFRRELRWNEELHARMAANRYTDSRPLCRAYPRLKRLIEREGMDG